MKFVGKVGETDVKTWVENMLSNLLETFRVHIYAGKNYNHFM